MASHRQHHDTHDGRRPSPQPPPQPPPPSVGGGFQDRHDLEAMKERMNREREAFFNNAGGGGHHHPADSGSADPFGGGFFSRASPRFDSFNRDRPYSPGGFQAPPRSFADRFSDMGSFPGGGGGSNSNTNSSPMRPNSGGSGGRPGQDRCGSSSAFDNCQSIPIKVVHTAKPRAYEGASHTTPIQPQQATQQSQVPQHGSPRLERAHSEPPKAFSQKLHKAQQQQQQPQYMTIPEQGGPGEGIHMSASSPSVPSNRGGGPAPSTQPQPAAPQAPPRRATTAGQPPPPIQPQSNPGSRKSSDQDQQQPAVRHIPIVVEGRDEPVFSRRMAAGDDSSRPNKPSDFYPSGVKRVPRNAAAAATKLDVNTQHHPSQEPTSPLSPPPSDMPIPMGFSPPPAEPHDPRPQGTPAQQEPLSPQPIPSDVPIPMTCSPNFMQESSQKEDQVDSTNTTNPEVEAATVAAKKEEGSDTAEPATKTAKKPDPAMDQLEKVRQAVKELTSRIEAFKGDKKDKEYLFLDEMLTRHMLSLDCIEANGRDDIRQMRKEAIKSINRCLSQLDHNSSAAAANNNAVIDQLVAESEAAAVNK